MNRPFCLSCGCIKESIQRDYCDDCVKSLVEELATLRQRGQDLEAQLAEARKDSEPPSDNRVDDLAMLLRRIVHRYEKGLDLDVQVRQIQDYITRHRLWGSILRREPDAAIEAAGKERGR